MTTGVGCSRKSSVLFFFVGLMLITVSKQSVTALSTSPFPSSPLLSLTRKNSIKLVLLDRDGVINVDVGAPGVVDPSQLVLTDRAATAIGTLQRQGHCRVVLITNQSCVGKGLITLDELNQIHKKLQGKLLADDSDARWDKVYACYTTKNVPDPRRKPRPGMILEACAEWDVDPADCVMIGDTLNDLRAAAAAGVSRRILVSTGYGQSIMKGIEPGRLVSDLTELPGFDKLIEIDGGIEDCGSIDTILPFHYVKDLATAILGDVDRIDTP